MKSDDGMHFSLFLEMQEETIIEKGYEGLEAANVAAIAIYPQETFWKTERPLCIWKGRNDSQEWFVAQEDPS